MVFFLIGFMGSGKSHWGRIWSAAHALHFIDLDEEIEKIVGKSIADIFEIHGEGFFRKKEAEVLRSIGNVQDTIISCGGGAPCYNDNLQWMQEHGITVYLLTTSKEILERVLMEQDKRPLIKKMNRAELLFFIEQKLKERSVFYDAARITITSNDISAASLGAVIAGLQAAS